MENKVYEITITKEEYDYLKQRRYEYDNILKEFYKLIRNATMVYGEDKLILNDDKIRELIKDYAKYEYDNRVQELNEEEENE